MRRRSTIKKMVDDRLKKIKKIESEIIELHKESYLLSDKNQWFIEKEEDVIISGRPKITEKRLIGRVHWRMFIKDEAYPDDKKKGIWIDMNQIVRVNGEWKNN